MRSRRFRYCLGRCLDIELVKIKAIKNRPEAGFSKNNAYQAAVAMALMWAFRRLL